MKKNNVQAIMNVNTGETIAGMWVTPHIPEIGVYKLLAKKKTNGSIEWVHFIHRDNGTKKELFRGELESEDRLQDVLDAANKILVQTFGPGKQMQVAEYDTYTPNGKKIDGAVN